MSLSLKDRLLTDEPSGLNEGAIPVDPPPWIFRAIGWGLILMFFTLVVAAVVVQVPETVEVPYILVPEGGADPVQAPLMAIVDKIHVVEGQQVSGGDEMFVLRSDEIRGWQTQLSTLEEDQQSKQVTLEKLASSYASEKKIRESEIEQYEQELEFRKRQLATGKDLVGRLEQLEDQGIVSTIEMMEHHMDLAETEKNLSLTQKALAQSRLEQQQLQTERDRRLREESAELEKIQVRIQALRSQLVDSKGALLSVRAPYAGVVISLKEQSPGGVVQYGQELCQLARLDGDPHARLLLDEQRLARVIPDQKIRLFFDAFPYQRYGTIMGRLDWVSPAAVASESGPQFIGLASLEATSIDVDGRSKPLQVGMKGFARIVVGTRTMAEVVFEPLRQLREVTRQ